MAEIDKGLPNVRQSVTLPSPDEKVEIDNTFPSYLVENKHLFKDWII